MTEDPVQASSMHVCGREIMTLWTQSRWVSCPPSRTQLSVFSGLAPMKTGEVRKVRVLGVLALIDSGETDWKVIDTTNTMPSCEDHAVLGDLPKN